MAIVTLSRIQHRKGQHDQLPQLAAAELGWAIDKRRLYIGNGTIADGAPELGNTELLTEHSDILALANQYTFRNADSGYNPKTAANNSNYRAITYSNGKYVVVGAGGQIVISLDGQTWNNTDSGTTNTLLGIAYAFGYFVAVGANGTIVISGNGTAWQTININNLVNLTSVSLLNGKLYVTANDGNLWTSTDAINYTQVVTGFTQPLYSIAYGSSTLVAVGKAGTAIYSTDNAVTWSAANTFTGFDLLAVKYQNSAFITTGQNSKTYYSTDGITWERSLVEGFVGGFIDTVMTNYYLTSYGVLYSVANGSFTSYSSLPTDLTYTAIDADNSNTTVVATTKTGKIYTSSDEGSTWTQTYTGSNALYGVYYDSMGSNKQWLVVGDNGTVLTSPNGLTWTARTTGITTALYAISQYGDTQYVAVGAAGTVITSPNGVTWTAATTGITTDFYTVAAVSHQNNTQAIVMGGQAGVIVYSDDLNNWSTVLSGSLNVNSQAVSIGNIRNIIYQSWVNPSLQAVFSFVIVGDDNLILSSTDLVSYEYVQTGASNHLTKIMYNSNKFYLLGDAGLSVQTSSDLLNWDYNSYVHGTNVNVPDLFCVGTNGVYNILAGQYGEIYNSTSNYAYRMLTGLKYDIYALVHGTIDLAIGDQGLLATSSDSLNWTSSSYTFGSTETKRTLQSKLDDFVSVKDFGAKGDGVSDDTLAINLALSELYVRFDNPATRKKLYFPAGTYLVSDSINLPTNANIQGEGQDNTILIQTRSPTEDPEVSWLLYTADSKQQIASNVGLNGAKLPGNMSICDMTLVSPGDCVVVDKAENIKFSSVKFLGNNATAYQSLNHASLGRPVAGVRFIGTELTPGRDISFYDCEFSYTNIGAYVTTGNYLDQAVFQSCYFHHLYQGFRNEYSLGEAKQVSISNSVFDYIYSSGISMGRAVNMISSFNSYREVGNHLLGDAHPYDIVVDFGAVAVDCCSLADNFNRSYASSLNVVRVSRSTETSDWYFGSGLRLGSYKIDNGRSVAILNNTTAHLNTGLDVNFTSDFAFEMFYTITRNGFVKSGYFKLVTNGSNHFFDDESNETGPTGTVLGFDGTDITYTSDTSGSGLLNYAIRYLEML